MARGSPVWWLKKPLAQNDLGLSLSSSSPLLCPLGLSCLPQTGIFADRAGCEASLNTACAGFSVWCITNVHEVLATIPDGPSPLSTLRRRRSWSDFAAVF